MASLFSMARFNVPYLPYLDTLTPFDHTCPKISTSILPPIVSKNCWVSGKQCVATICCIMWHLIWVFAVCSGLLV